MRFQRNQSGIYIYKSYNEPGVGEALSNLKIEGIPESPF